MVATEPLSQAFSDFVELNRKRAVLKLNPLFDLDALASASQTVATSENSGHDPQKILDAANVATTALNTYGKIQSRKFADDLDELQGLHDALTPLKRAAAALLISLGTEIKPYVLGKLIGTTVRVQTAIRIRMDRMRTAARWCS